MNNKQRELQELLNSGAFWEDVKWLQDLEPNFISSITQLLFQNQMDHSIISAFEKVMNEFIDLVAETLRHRPVDLRSSHDAAIALKMRGEDPEPFKEALEALSYPVHMIIDKQTNRVLVWEEGQPWYKLGAKLHKLTH